LKGRRGFADEGRRARGGRRSGAGERANERDSVKSEGNFGC